MSSLSSRTTADIRSVTLTVVKIVSQQVGAPALRYASTGMEIECKNDGLTGEFLYIKNNFHVVKASETL